MAIMDLNSTIKSNLDKTNSINFGISNTEVVIDILTSKLYSSPVYTTCQELLSNALDSTLERSKYLKVSECSGTSNPSRIKISLPGVFSNKLVIRDYGLGLSEEDLCSKYTQIGYSSKRSTNDYIGSFGIGRLSPFSFCNSFSVKSYYDGVSYSYLVYKDNGSIRLTHISTISTEEPNGLEVSVAIPNDYISKVGGYVRRLVTFFPEDIRPDIFDYPSDLEIKEYLDTEQKIIKYCESTEFHSNVVCGYVPYRLDKFDSFKFCLFYKVGELKISPSREQISEDSYDLIRKDIELLTIYLDKTKIREMEEILKSRDLFTQNSFIRLNKLSKSLTTPNQVIEVINPLIPEITIKYYHSKNKHPSLQFFDKDNNKVAFNIYKQRYCFDIYKVVTSYDLTLNVTKQYDFIWYEKDKPSKIFCARRRKVVSSDIIILFPKDFKGLELPKLEDYKKTPSPRGSKSPSSKSSSKILVRATDNFSGPIKNTFVDITKVDYWCRYKDREKFKGYMNNNLKVNSLPCVIGFPTKAQKVPEDMSHLNIWDNLESLKTQIRLTRLLKLRVKSVYFSNNKLTYNDLDYKYFAKAVIDIILHEKYLNTPRYKEQKNTLEYTEQERSLYPEVLESSKYSEVFNQPKFVSKRFIKVSPIKQLQERLAKEVKVACDLCQAFRFIISHSDIHYFNYNKHNNIIKSCINLMSDYNISIKEVIEEIPRYLRDFKN